MHDILREGCPAEIFTRGADKFWEFFTKVERFQKGLGNKFIRLCSEDVGLNGALFFPTSKDAEEWGSKNFISGSHKHETWEHAVIMGPIYMAGENHIVAQLANKVGYPKSAGEKALIQFFTGFSKSSIITKDIKKPPPPPPPPPHPPKDSSSDEDKEFEIDPISPSTDESLDVISNKY